MHKRLSLCLLSLTVVWYVCTSVIVGNVTKEALMSGSVVFGSVFLLLYLIFNIILFIFGKSSSSTILCNTINRITLIPVYTLLYFFGMVFFAICPFLITLDSSKEAYVYAPIYSSIVILVISFVIAIGQCLGIIKTCKMGQLQKVEAIIYSICSFIPFVGIIIGFVAFSRSLPKKDAN